MLNTRERSIYLEELKPPEGFRFDSAIATTFTLDLLTLLMAPLSLSLYETGDRDELLQDPVLLLDALRNVANNFSIFCQDGYISVPKKSSLLYSYLEDSVFPVKPVRGHGIFHPKLWVLRYIRDNEVFYRLLNLSRNLTFDKSWDIVVCLEGEVTDRKNGFTKNKPIRDFIYSLEHLSSLPVSDARKKQLSIIANEVYRVYFETPSGFEDVSNFSPSGISGYKKQANPNNFNRALIISPFLTEEGVNILKKQGTDNVLISRAESLDMLSDEAYDDLINTTSLYYLEQSVEMPDEEIEHGNPRDDYIGGDAKGLHAKLFLFEHGWNASLIAGSANATSAGLNGENVEFMIHLSGKRSKMGIDRFIGADQDQSNGLMNLLSEYRRYEELQDEKNEQTELENLLQELWKSILSAALYGEVLEEDGNTFILKIESESKLPIFKENSSVKCFPISLSEDKSIDVHENSNIDIRFESLSLPALTSFIAFELSIERGEYRSSISFVTNIPIKGIPKAERTSAILSAILKDRGSFIRYLFLILLDDPDAFQLSELFVKDKRDSDNSVYSDDKATLDIPLLEELVRAFSRNPEKIERIEQLVKDIEKTAQGSDIIPPFFHDTWQTFITAYVERGEA